MGAHHNGELSSTDSSEATPPNHLGTNVPSGHFDGNHDPEKQEHHMEAPAMEKKRINDDDEEDEDMDALIDDLESQDGHQEDADEEETAVGGERPVPEELLQTSTRTGLSDAEVTQRRKKYGLNQLREEKENLILKFLGYFVGPIQFVMEVSYFPFIISKSQCLESGCLRFFTTRIFEANCQEISMLTQICPP